MVGNKKALGVAEGLEISVNRYYAATPDWRGTTSAIMVETGCICVHGSRGLEIVSSGILTL